MDALKAGAELLDFSRALEPGIVGRGALGPVEAFGLDELLIGCEEAGLEANVTVRTAG